MFYLCCHDSGWGLLSCDNIFDTLQVTELMFCNSSKFCNLEFCNSRQKSIICMIQKHSRKVGEAVGNRLGIGKWSFYSALISAFISFLHLAPEKRSGLCGWATTINLKQTHAMVHLCVQMPKDKWKANVSPILFFFCPYCFSFFFVSCHNN